MEKLVSVIIPVYKVEKFLSECIESVINQTHKNLEIILVDDGSPDNCGEICDEYAKRDNRVKVIHKENGGLSSARNAGLEVANGEYISFIDSDDYVANNYIEKLYKLCVENDADIAECDFLKFEKVEEIKKNKIKDEIVESYTSVEMQERMYSEYGVRTVIVCNKLYNKKIYNELKFPNGKLHEDEFITYKALDKAKKIVLTNQKLYFYRCNYSSITNQKFNIKKLDAVEAMQERKEYYKRDKHLYECTVKRYQDLLREYYILAKKDMKKEKSVLMVLYDLAKENFKEYRRIKGLKFKNKVKNYLFMIMPQVYSTIMIKKRNNV